MEFGKQRKLIITFFFFTLKTLNYSSNCSTGKFSCPHPLLPRGKNCRKTIWIARFSFRRVPSMWNSFIKFCRKLIPKRVENHRDLPTAIITVCIATVVLPRLNRTELWRPRCFYFPPSTIRRMFSTCIHLLAKTRNFDRSCILETCPDYEIPLPVCGLHGDFFTGPPKIRPTNNKT